MAAYVSMRHGATALEAHWNTLCGFLYIKLEALVPGRDFHVAAEAASVKRVTRGWEEKQLCGPAGSHFSPSWRQVCDGPELLIQKEKWYFHKWKTAAERASGNCHSIQNSSWAMKEHRRHHTKYFWCSKIFDRVREEQVSYSIPMHVTSKSVNIM